MPTISTLIVVKNVQIGNQQNLQNVHSRSARIFDFVDYILFNSIDSILETKIMLFIIKYYNNTINYLPL